MARSIVIFVVGALLCFACVDALRGPHNVPRREAPRPIRLGFDFDKTKVTETITSWIAATKTLNATVVASLYASDSQQTDPAGAGAPISGKSAIEQAWQGLFSLPNLKSYGCVSNNGIIANGNSAAVMCRVVASFSVASSVGKAADCDIVLSEILTFSVDDSYLISAYSAYYDMDAFLPQLQKCCPSCV